MVSQQAMYSEKKQNTILKYLKISFWWYGCHIYVVLDRDPTESFAVLYNALQPVKEKSKYLKQVLLMRPEIKQPNIVS